MRVLPALRLTLVALTAFLGGAVAMGVAAPVAASCRVLPDPAQAIREAQVAFVGTVVAVSNNDRWATVAVEEVWRGPDLPTTVEVRGGPAGNTATSIDRTFVAATRYLFTVSAAGGGLTDTACSATTPWTPELARLRPADARAPIRAAVEPTATDPISVAAPLIAVAAIGAALFGIVALLALRRRRAS